MDIFISYASPDRTRVAPLVAALENEGWSVWWDRKIDAGTAYDREIQNALPKENASLTQIPSAAHGWSLLAFQVAQSLQGRSSAPLESQLSSHRATARAALGTRPDHSVEMVGPGSAWRR
ncbi:MAG TPA: toll/interleukin-1 receptor domain-containing protein [Gammaproteobacteria bacterium]|nr:toll/interleukin-1 receptor domain-containing protein [Gammaproteobacteria bacterium]HIL95714.1 toll/interleukin-1 receptor domain-containing protein [Pseudomonadales bacterium]